jgi:hypothetical protein
MDTLCCRQAAGSTTVRAASLHSRRGQDHLAAPPKGRLVRPETKITGQPPQRTTAGIRHLSDNQPSKTDPTPCPFAPWVRSCSALARPPRPTPWPRRGRQRHPSRQRPLLLRRRSPKPGSGPSAMRRGFGRPSSGQPSPAESALAREPRRSSRRAQRQCPRRARRTLLAWSLPRRVPPSGQGGASIHELACAWGLGSCESGPRV